MATPSELRVGLATRLATITGLNTYEEAPGTITVPAAFPIPSQGPIEYDETMDSDVCDFSFRIRLLVQRSTEKIAQANLDPYLAASGTSSIRAAINGDQTLGGKADWARVARVARYGDIEHNGISYLGADFDVEVNADGDG